MATESGSAEAALMELMEPDDSIGTESNMDQLVEITRGGDVLNLTVQTTIQSALMATKRQDLLSRFSHSSALERVHEWLQATLQDPIQPKRTVALLLLLSHLPMTITSLQNSGVGKTVNKLRKNIDSDIQNGAVDLLKNWKAIASAVSSSAEAPATTSAETPVPAVKRSLDAKPSATTHVEKKSKISVDHAHDMADESALDSALSAESTRRKASLKPDHLRPRRPVQPISIPPPARGGSAPKSPTSPVNRDATQAAGASNQSGSSDVLTSRTIELAAPAPSTRRVQWAPAGSLAEIREYVIEDAKKRPNSGFKDQLAFDVEREKQTMLQQRSHQLDLLDIIRPSCSSTESDSGAIGSTLRAENGPQPTRPWVTPPLLPESLWPAFKGDASNEREVQRHRRSLVPSTSGLGPQETPADPPAEEQNPTRADSSVPVIPLERVALNSGSASLDGCAASLGTTGGVYRPVGHLEGPMGGVGGIVAGGMGMNGLGGLSLEQQMMHNLMPGGCRMHGCGVLNNGGTVNAAIKVNGMAGAGMVDAPGMAMPGGVHPGGMMANAAAGINSAGVGINATPGGMNTNGLGNLVGLSGGSMMNNPMNGMGVMNGMHMNGIGGMLPHPQGQQKTGGADLTNFLSMQMLLQGNKQGNHGGMGGNGLNRVGAGTGIGAFGNTGFDGNLRRDPTTHPKFRTKPCRYFAAGGCKNGDRCTFQHVELSSEQYAREFGTDGVHHGGHMNTASGEHRGHYGPGSGPRPTHNSGRLPGIGGPLWMP